MQVFDTVSMYTQPTTEAQKFAAALHKNERLAYTIGENVIQVFWALTDLPSFVAILYSITSFFPGLAPYVFSIALLIVLSLHFILKATLKVKLHYMMESATIKDDIASNLDWNKAKVPLMIAMVLYGFSVTGLWLFEQQNGYKATIVNVDSSLLEKEAGTIEKMYDTMQKSVEQKIDARMANKLSPIESKIANLEAKRPINNWHKGVISNEIADLKRQKRQLESKFSSEKSKAIDSILAKKAMKIDDATSRYNSFANNITTQNDSEIAKQQVSAKFGSRYSWIISFILLALFFGANTRLATLSYIEDRKPIFNSSSVKNLLFDFYIATRDIVYRQGKRFIKKYHELGTTGATIIPEIDGSAGRGESDYHAQRIPSSTTEMQQTEVVAQQDETVITENATETQQSATVTQQEEAVITENATIALQTQQLENLAKQLEKERLEREKAERVAILAQKELRLKQEEADRIAQQERDKREQIERERMERESVAQQERERAQQLERETQQKAALAQQEREKAQQIRSDELVKISEHTDELFIKLRSDFSNLKNGNGKFETVKERIEGYFETLGKYNGEGKLSDAKSKKVVQKWSQYQGVLKEKEVQND